MKKIILATMISLYLININAMDKINESSQSKNEAVNQLKMLLSTLQAQNEPTSAETQAPFNNPTTCIPDIKDYSDRPENSEFNDRATPEIEQGGPTRYDDDISVGKLFKIFNSLCDKLNQRRQ